MPYSIHNFLMINVKAALDTQIYYFKRLPLLLGLDLRMGSSGGIFWIIKHMQAGFNLAVLHHPARVLTVPPSASPLASPKNTIQSMHWILALTTLVASVKALASPALVLSHKLVPDLALEVEKPYTKHQDPQNVTNMIKKLVTECSSDIYLLVNIPGLTSAEMTGNKEHIWPNVIKYIHMSSSVVGVPWVDGPLDFQFLENYIIKTCKAEAVNVHFDAHEMPKYIDTRKRVVHADLSPLPEDRELRYATIRHIDELIGEILRKAPSPHYTIVILLDVLSPVHPIPQFALDESPERFEIFYDLILSRKQEVERNNYMYNDVEPYWNHNGDPMKAYLERRKKDEIHFFNYELWQKNEKLISTIALMIATLFVMKIFAFGRWVVAKSGKPHQD